MNSIKKASSKGSQTKQFKSTKAKGQENWNHALEYSKRIATFNGFKKRVAKKKEIKKKWKRAKPRLDSKIKTVFKFKTNLASL